MDFISQQKLHKQTYVLGLNHMSDWSDEEYNSILGLLPDEVTPQEASQDANEAMIKRHKGDRPVDDPSRPFVLATDSDSMDEQNATEGRRMLIGGRNNKAKIETPVPQDLSGGLFSGEVNWKKSVPPVVTKIKDQGMCGSGYAMAVTAALEAAQAFQSRSEAISLSTQQVMDCSSDAARSYKNAGCSGGYLDQTINYIHDNTVFDADTMPYKGKDKKCDDSRRGLDAK